MRPGNTAQDERSKEFKMGTKSVNDELMPSLYVSIFETYDGDYGPEVYWEILESPYNAHIAALPTTEHHHVSTSRELAERFIACRAFDVDMSDVKAAKLARARFFAKEVNNG